MNKTTTAMIIILGTLLPGFASADSGQELRDAAAKGDLPRVEQLIRAGANVNDIGKSGGTPLIQAAKNGHVEVAQALLFHGADPSRRNKKGNSALDLADKSGYEAISTILRTSLNEQSVSIDAGKTLTPEDFRRLVDKTFARRNWKIEHAEPDRYIGRYDRKGIAYKVEARQGGSLIALKFLRGYGAKSASYLENLKKDMIIELK